MMYPYHDPAALIAIYNEELRAKGRTDIRWSLDPNGTPFLHEDRQWTAKHTAALKAKAEQERRNWMRAQREAA